jgi:hypothetical protein
MATIFLKFLQPYALMLLGMTYSLQQALEGIGINPTRFEPWRNNSGAVIGSAPNVDDSLGLPILALVVFLVVWLFLFMGALSKLWGRLATWFGGLLLTTPGLLALFDAWPHIQWLPRSYVIGSGYVGSPLGILLLQGAAMTTGWALTVSLTHWLKLDDRFRHGFDQFWYALAISAGLFFVADLNANDQRDDLRQSAATSRAASSYLLDQVRRLDRYCQSDSVKLPLACKWARSSQWQLEDYAHQGERLYWQLGPEQEWTIYAGSGATHNDMAVDALRQELQQYNLRMCPVTDLGGGVTRASRVSSTCQMTPPEFCTSYPARKLAGVDPAFGAARTVAIANECIVPTLSRLKVEQASLAGAVDDSAKARNLRTMFFIFVAFVAGGKVANASVRMTDEMRRRRVLKPTATSYVPPKPQSRFFGIFAGFMNGIRGLWRTMARRFGK